MTLLHRKWDGNNELSLAVRSVDEHVIEIMSLTVCSVYGTCD